MAPAKVHLRAVEGVLLPARGLGGSALPDLPADHPEGGGGVPALHRVDDVAQQEVERVTPAVTADQEALIAVAVRRLGELLHLGQGTGGHTQLL